MSDIFFMRNTNFINYWKSKASYNTRESTKEGVSSIHDTKLLIPLACWTIVWAGLLSCLCTCTTRYCLKVCSLRWMPDMIFSKVIGACVVSERDPASTAQSVSNIASCKPMSVANEAASSIALASASSGPNGNGKCLLKATSTIPSVEVGRVWLKLPSPIHSYKPNSSSIRKPSTSRIVTPCNSRPMTYIYIYILGLW